MKKNQISRLEFKRKVAKKIDGQKIYFISPEDLILKKLHWCRISESSRHLEDAESVIKISGNILDFNYLKKWAKKLDVAGVLAKLLKNKNSDPKNRLGL